jgi:geranylgeranyl diphosphate synthase type II
LFLGLESEHKDFQYDFSASAEKYFSARRKFIPETLYRSMRYSFDSGGKRFRPFLCYLIAKSYNADTQKIMALAIAVELIHTYSLIHDDLPCMDNDDFRRGCPANHKKFGDGIALLAGDALQAEAFGCIANDDLNSAEHKISVLKIFSDLIGAKGMVGGQILDMQAAADTTLAQLENIHRRKTGDLISASVLGAAIFSEAPNISGLSIFAENLGLAFQIKDDLLDGLDGAQDHKSYLKILGIEKTNEKLKYHTDSAQKSINSDLLKKIIHFNLVREK